GIVRPGQVKKILTSLADEGSHRVARRFVEAWQIGDKVQFVHDWQRVTSDADYQVPDDVDAVFVVKDPADEKTVAGVNRFLADGFQLRSPEIGARASKFDFLKAT